MQNNENMTLNLKRRDVCDIRIALTSIINDMQRELQDENTTDSRKEIVANSIKKWETLKAEIIRQMNEQDAE